ncbi:MAG: DNA/RNA nuclease SfsA [Magnetovibrio sp.]|nr:DNA/RNA nuclease SfsA [Magnetovibrio sp.]
MKFHAPLVKGTLVKRYKRFMADVTLEDGTVVTAHCANSGSMLSVNEPAAEVWISPAANPDRKLKWTWELIRIGKTLVGINTALPNAIVAEAIEAGKVAELTGYETLRREVKYGQNSRIDILLEDPKKGLCYVEIKNVTMRRDLADGPLEFPDGVTSRGAKHLVELADMVAQGHRAVMLYLVQREDGNRFEVAGDIDPAYADGLEEARMKGVEVLCYRCKVTPKDISLSSPVPIAP